MSLIKKIELTQMNELQLKEKMADLKKELLKINAKRATHAIPEKPKRGMLVRKTIARINTILHQKRLAKTNVKPINKNKMGGNLKDK